MAKKYLGKVEFAYLKSKRNTQIVFCLEICSAQI